MMTPSTIERQIPYWGTVVGHFGSYPGRMIILFQYFSELLSNCIHRTGQSLCRSSAIWTGLDCTGLEGRIPKHIQGLLLRNRTTLGV